MNTGEKTDLAGILKGIMSIEVGSGRIMGIRRDSMDFYLLQNLGPLGDSLGDRFASHRHVILPSDIRYGKICLNAEAREFFPGVRDQFILDTNFGPFLLHRQHDSYLNAPRKSEANRVLLKRLGGEGVRPFSVWYENNPKIRVGNTVVFYKVDSDTFILNK